MIGFTRKLEVERFVGSKPMNSKDLGKTVSCSAYATCHAILVIMVPEMCTCEMLGAQGCGTLGTLDPDRYTWHGTLEPRIPR